LKGAVRGAFGTSAGVSGGVMGRDGGNGGEVTMRSLFTGAADGTVATLAMSGVMFGAQRAGWLGEMPPRKITKHALRRAGAAEGRRTKDALSALAHVAFGAAAGSLFESLHATWGRRVGPVGGAAFGVAVWLVSYAGWVPGLRLLPPPRRDDPGRQVSMVIAHVVYGAVLGALADRRLPRRRAAPPALALAEGRDGARLQSALWNEIVTR
jgi:uncharacterized membrane protein YagU involved in acid resistance